MSATSTAVHERAAPRLHRDEVLQREALDRLAQRRAPDLELAHQRVLAQHRPRRQPQRDDPVAQLVVGALGEQPASAASRAGWSCRWPSRVPGDLCRSRRGACPTRPGPDISEVMATRTPALDGWLGVEAVRDARERTRDLVRHTPVLTSRSLSDECGGTVLLKAENLQRTGSFKLRGALAKVDRLARCGADRARASWPAAPATTPSRWPTPRGPAGSTARSSCRPRHRWRRWPRSRASAGPCGSAATPSTPASRTPASARPRPARRSCIRSTIPEIVAGQGTLGLELLDDVEDLATLVVPVGGGGLISGVAGVVKAARPGVRVIGVQVEAARPTSPRWPRRAGRGRRRPDDRRRHRDQASGRAHAAPGAAWVDDIVVVAEDDVAEAMVVLLERAKLVVEGAGAVGVAALLAGAVVPARAARPSSCSPAATSTPACSRPSPCATRPPRAGACASSRASRTSRAGSRACSPRRRGRRQPRHGHARARGGPAARRQTGVDLCSRRAAPTTPRRSSLR